MVEIIRVKVQPKASANRVEGFELDASGLRQLKVRLTIAPEGGKANSALIKLLAAHWGCAARDLEIVSGHKSRYKRIQINATIDLQKYASTH